MNAKCTKTTPTLLLSEIFTAQRGSTEIRCLIWSNDQSTRELAKRPLSFHHLESMWDLFMVLLIIVQTILQMAVYKNKTLCIPPPRAPSHRPTNSFYNERK